MKFLIVNGSPKGDYSITLQTCRYLELKYKAHQFSYLNAGAKINSLIRDFSPAKEALKDADVIIFSYPVYTFIAPYQLHKFIELIKASDIEVSGKWATQITTSKHFYDITAHNYIKENCFDLGLKFVNGLSADMDDLTKTEGQIQACKFFDFLLWSISNDISEKKNSIFTPAKNIPASVPEADNSDKAGDIVIVTDTDEGNENLNNMIKRFSTVAQMKTRVLNLNDVKIKGGCLGCFNCAVSGECVYKDGFSEILRNNIQKADAIVYAFAVKDHSMGCLFKMYDDRQFCNGHRSVTSGMPVGYLISGNYSEEDNLRMILEGRSQVGGNFLAGIATDERDTDNDIDELAKKLIYAVENKHSQPANFLGVGGMKIFRDLVYMMRGMMRADHKFYKKHKLYDFPQKHKLMSSAMYLVGGMLGNDKLRSRMGNRMNEGMLMPYVSVIEKAKKN